MNEEQVVWTERATIVDVLGCGREWPIVHDRLALYDHRVKCFIREHLLAKDVT